MTNSKLVNSRSAWFQIRVPVTEEIEDAIINFLFESGCCGCQQLQGTVLAYFPGTHIESEIHQRILDYFRELSALGFNLPGDKIEAEIVENQDWNANWKKYFEPIVISKGIVVKPTWETLQKPFSGVVIEIDPKQAFGTGIHATTQLVLWFLEKYLLKDSTVLDVGTGTGILAIAAVKLNAGPVFALDKETIAIEAACENIHNNETKLKLLVGELNSLRPSEPYFDLILANLNKIEISNLWSDFIRLLKNSGLLIISGILKEERYELIEQISEKSDLKIIDENDKEEWIAIVFKKEQIK